MIQWSICQIPLCTVIRDLAENFWHGKVTNSWRWWWGKRCCSYLLNPLVMRKPYISASDSFLRAEVFNKQDLIKDKIGNSFNRISQEILKWQHKETLSPWNMTLNRNMTALTLWSTSIQKRVGYCGLHISTLAGHTHYHFCSWNSLCY